MADEPTGMEHDDEQYVDFPIPEGFEPPKGTKPGKEFEALATLKIDDDGDLCLLKLDGVEVKPEAEEEGEEAGEGEAGSDDTGGQPEGQTNPSAVDSMRQALPGLGMPTGISAL
jgi:hypothetical protein